MTPADELEFGKILMGLSAIKPGKAMTPEGIALFWSSMQGWTIGEFREAANLLARTAEFMPNPYHFEQLRKAAQPSSAEAWTQVVERVRRMRPDEIVSIDERTDRVVRAMGGYRRIGLTNSDEMHFRAKAFAELWEELGEVDETRQALPNLMRHVLSGPQSVAAMLPDRAGLQLKVVGK